MIDRERIIEELEMILFKCGETRCEDCKYGRKVPARPYSCKLDEYEIMGGALELLKEQPELIRCKDCKYGVQLDDSNYYVCGKPFASNRETHTAEWFCADGTKEFRRNQP